MKGVGGEVASGRGQSQADSAGLSTSFAGYEPPPTAAGTKWFLDANEGRPVKAVLDALAGANVVEAARRYPRATALEELIAARPGPGVGALGAGSVLVTAGSDDAIARACRVFLGRADRLLVFEPAFEMYAVSSRLVGADVVGMPWPEAEAFPLAQAVDAARRLGVKAVAVASPANPTGGAARPEELLALADALPDTSIWIDGAYGEFSDADPIGLVCARQNILMMRSFSKAHGLAGMRLGWVAGPPLAIAKLRAAGAPYPVGGLSVVAGIAARGVEAGAQRKVFLERVRLERKELFNLLARMGARPAPSEANFVFARVKHAAEAKAALAAVGIAIRTFQGRSGLEDAIRITCPGDEAGWAELVAALGAAKEWL